MGGEEGEKGVVFGVAAGRPNPAATLTTRLSLTTEHTAMGDVTPFVQRSPARGIPLEIAPPTDSGASQSPRRALNRCRNGMPTASAAPLTRVIASGAMRGHGGKERLQLGLKKLSVRYQVMRLFRCPALSLAPHLS
jgi:hypothetical protein